MCLTVGTTGGLCSATCTTDGDCGENGHCSITADGGVSACFRTCSSKSDCPSTPCIWQASIGAGRTLLFTSTLDRDWNDLPIHPGFLPLMQQTVRHLARKHAAFGDTVFLAALANVQGAQKGFVSTDGKTGDYSSVWTVERDWTNRTSLIVDPPDGHLPALSERAKALLTEARLRRTQVRASVLRLDQTCTVLIARQFAN